ncbi:TetR/AcrR family transcriptional regulator C-terminal domain-containing protein [Kribbella sancticallisti]|uniref:TetR/AcrR family transcriptional regulator C-terminal domain-containing protein n=1 Tax=Kribbella sancticallisti TaxID=460087 RepID=A0ABP4PRX2_9ACTN
MVDSIWTRSRASAPARDTLSREQIVKAAIELLDQEGLAGLSMRKLATKLASGATSLYWYVQTKDDLIDLVIDEIYGEVDVPEAELAGWRAGTLLFAHSLRATVLRHPWLPEVIYTRPSIGPKAVSLGSRGLALFGAAGFTSRDLDYAMGSVMAYVLGQASAEVAMHSAVKKSGRTVEEWTGDVMEQAKATVDDHPEMQESLRRRSALDAAQLQNEYFAFGLDSLLDGIEARLRT